jgi:hypothetical protein
MLPKQIGWSLFGIAVSAGIGNTVASVFRVPYEVGSASFFSPLRNNS